jgi:hypothetical protein
MAGVWRASHTYHQTRAIRLFSHSVPEPGAVPIPHIRPTPENQMSDPFAAGTELDPPSTSATVEADAFKLALALIATLTGEAARCTRRTCRRAGHCTAAAHGDLCRQPRVLALDSFAQAGSEFLLHHVRKYPLPRPGRARRGAGEG